MIPLPFALLLASVIEPSSINLKARERLMDRIERAVILPQRAAPLSDYGRNFAPLGNGQIVAIYLRPAPPITEQSNCVHGDMKPCSTEEIQKLNADRASVAAAGERRWFTDPSDLPKIVDGGCSVITIHYDLPQERVISVFCNGQ
jgi:hypothetical protein